MANDDDKKARAVIEEKRQRGEGNDPTVEQPDLTESGRPPDTLDPRAKSSGHGKKTADKWNQ
jgi:hypothetical protein